CDLVDAGSAIAVFDAVARDHVATLPGLLGLIFLPLFDGGMRDWGELLAGARVVTVAVVEFVVAAGRAAIPNARLAGQRIEELRPLRIDAPGHTAGISQRPFGCLRLPKLDDLFGDGPQFLARLGVEAHQVE